MPGSSASIAAVMAEASAIRRSGEQMAEGMTEIAHAITTLAIDLASGDREWLSVRDAAEILGVGQDTIRRAIKAGHLPYIRVGQERTGIRIGRADLAVYAHSLL